MRKIFTSVAMLSGALVFPALADKVTIEQLPKQDQQAIRSQVGRHTIQDIDRETRNGKTVYEVAFKDNGQHREIKVDALPAPVVATPAPAPALDSRKLTFNELPASIRQAAESRLQGGEVNDVDRQVRNGQTTYEIGFKRNGGAQQELVIAQDGRVLSDTTAATAVVGSTPQSNPAPVAPPTRDGNRGPATRVKAMEYNELPASIQKVAAQHLRDGHVSDVERRIRRGDIEYQIGFLKENGQRQELVVAESGTVLRNEVVAARPAGAPAQAETGTSSDQIISRPAAYADITSPVQLSNLREIEKTAMPSAVRRVVRQQTNNREVEEVLQGQWNGQRVYQVGFMDENRKYVEVQYDDQGNVVFDPRAITNPGTESTGRNLLNNLGRLFENQ